MSAPLLLFPGGHPPLAPGLCAALGVEPGRLELRAFPDGETYLRLLDDPRGRDVVLVCDLSRPDPKLVPLLFLCDAARELGASRVGLVLPYLPYMRQDTRFHPGEAVTSASLGRLLSRAADWLITVDPHLHRHASLDEVLAIPSRVVPAAPAIATWVKSQVPRPLLVGPDEESAQWVSAVAAQAGAPHTVLRKVRSGDREVRLTLPDLSGWHDRTPVLVDDIVSTARTMAVAVARLREAGLPAPVCVGVHALFCGDALAALQAAGPARVVTCDTVPHPTNAIPLAAPLAAAVRELLGGGGVTRS